MKRGAGLLPGQVWKDTAGARWIVFDARKEFRGPDGKQCSEYLIRSDTEITYRMSTDIHGWERVG